MTKIKILHYLRHLALGGTEKTCQLFFEHASKDFEAALAHEKNGDKTRYDEFAKAARVCGGNIFEIDSYKTPTPESHALQQCIDRFKPDILHVYRSGLPEFPEPAIDVKVPHTVETNVFGFLDQNPAIDRTLFMSKWLMDAALRGISPINRALLFRAKRFDFVNNPVEMPYSDHPIPGISRDCIWVGRCGRPDNGIYNSVNVEAVRLLRMQGYDIHFLVVAPPSNMIEDLVRYDIPFKMIEPTTNPLVLSQFYNSIDIYAHARADGETFGVNIAEAMLHGKPVVTHIATPSNPHMGVFQAQTELVDDHETGFVVANNPAAYADALKQLIDSSILRESMGYAATVKAMREYHVDVCMQKLENIYKEVTNES